MTLALRVLLLAWAVAFIGSFVAFRLTASDEVGLAAGLNKVGMFLGWQAVAGALALLAALSTRHVPRGSRLRWLGLAPLGVLLLLLVAFAALVGWANLQRSAHDVPAPSQVAVPAKPDITTGSD